MTPGPPPVIESEGEEPFPIYVESPSLRFASAIGLRDAGRVLRDFVTYLPTQLVPAIAGFVALPILAHRLAPTELGVLTLAQTLSTLGWIGTSQWLAFAITRELPSARAAGDLATFGRTLRGSLLTTVGFLGLFALVVALMSLVSGAVRDNGLLVVAVTAGLSLQNVSGTLLTAELRTKPYAVLELLSRTGGIALGIYLVFQGHKLGGYLFGLASVSLVTGAVGLAIAWPRRGRAAPRTGGRHVRAWLDYGLPFAVSGAAFWGLMYVDRYLLSALASAGEVGVYSLGAVVGDKFVSIPILAFYTAARPLLLHAFERSGRTEVERLMRAYTRVILLLGVPIVVYAAVTDDEVIRLVGSGDYASSYAAAASVIPLVALGTLIYMLALIGNVGLTVGRRTSKLVYGSIAGLAANVVANVILIPPFGAVGAAVSTPVGTGAFLLATLYWARHHARWRFPYRTLLRVGVAAALAAVAAAVAVHELSGTVEQLLAAAAAGGAVYVLALAVLGELRPGAAAGLRAGSSSS